MMAGFLSMPLYFRDYIVGVNKKFATQSRVVIFHR